MLKLKAQHYRQSFPCVVCPDVCVSFFCRSKCTRCSTGSRATRPALAPATPSAATTPPMCWASTPAGWWCPRSWTPAWPRAGPLWTTTPTLSTLQVGTDPSGSCLLLVEDMGGRGGLAVASAIAFSFGKVISRMEDIGKQERGYCCWDEQIDFTSLNRKWWFLMNI